MPSALSVSKRPLSAALALALLFTLLAMLPGIPAPSAKAVGPNTYVTLSDGTSIALNVRMPKRFEEGKSFPTIFEMSGYEGGSADGEHPYAGKGSRALTEMFEGDYVTIHASVRGSGCSGGKFDLFSWRSALDGRENHRVDHEAAVVQRRCGHLRTLLRRHNRVHARSHQSTRTKKPCRYRG